MDIPTGCSCQEIVIASPAQRVARMRALRYLLLLFPAQLLGQAKRLEQLHNKIILVFTPHPDDDVFGAGGTIALLNKNDNRVYVVVYTNDDKGSYDPEMSSQ